MSTLQESPLDTLLREIIPNHASFLTNSEISNLSMLTSKLKVGSEPGAIAGGWGEGALQWERGFWCYGKELEIHVRGGYFGGEERRMGSEILRVSREEGERPPYLL